MIDHVSITVRDLAAARAFYDAVFEALGVPCVYARADALGYGSRERTGGDEPAYLSVFRSAQAGPDPRRHWCFRAASRDAVDRFHAAGLAAGGRDEGAPGLRPHYHAHYYAAFLSDPDGNRIEAVHHLVPR